MYNYLHAFFVNTKLLLNCYIVIIISYSTSSKYSGQGHTCTCTRGHRVNNAIYIN